MSRIRGRGQLWPTLVSMMLLNVASAAETVRYQVRVPAELDRLQVRVCPESGNVARFHSRHPAAPRFLSIEGGPATADGDAIEYSGRDGECFEYRTDLAGAISEGDRRLAVRRGDAVITTSGLWLWRPASASPAESRIEFLLPGDFRVTVPWQPTGGQSSRSPAYVLADTPPGWPDRMALGRFEYRTVPVAGASLRVATLRSDPSAALPGMAAWISEAAGAVATLYGRFPLTSPQILIISTAPVGEPVPWAQVLRGGGASAHFFVDASRPLEEFRRDWTATHELSHMLLPYVLRRDAWLSEGFASYFQNILRARAGMLPEREAWLELYEGFERGRLGTRGLTLREASRNMDRNGLYMRVYWSGAAIALMADLELRRRTDGRVSLGTALEALAACCLPSRRAWGGRELLQRLDELTGQTVFAELYRRHIDSPAFPDLREASASLGIEHGAGGIAFSSDGGAAELRAAIMSPSAVEQNRKGRAFD